MSAAKKSTRKTSAKKKSARKKTSPKKKKGTSGSTRKKTTKKKTTKKKTKKTNKKSASKSKPKSARKTSRKKTAKKKTAGKPSAKKKSAAKTSRKKSKSGAAAASKGKKKPARRKRRTTRRKKIVSIFRALPAPPPPPPASQIASQALDIFEKGMTQFHKKAYEKAETFFQQITDAFPAEKELRARVRMYLRLCEQHLGSVERNYKQARDHYYRAVVLSNRGEHDSAVEHLESALRMVRRRKNTQVQEDQVHYVMAAAHCLAGRVKKAARALDKAIELNPRNRVLAVNSPDFENLRESNEHNHLLQSPLEEE